MKILIVDDERPARSRLASLVSELDVGEVVGDAGNGKEALALAGSTSADIVLLDIRMPGMDGLEVARHLAVLPEPPAVIFTTAFDEHALAAFETNAVDYLLKPIRRGRLEEALIRARRLTRAQLVGVQVVDEVAKARTHISATMQGSLRVVPVSEVRFFRAEHKYVTARYLEGELLLDEPLTSLEAEFSSQFMRVHRNALVATAHLEGLDKDPQGRLSVHLTGVEESIEVSRRLAAQVRRAVRGGELSSPAT